jgi:hypothetical protein
MSEETNGLGSVTEQMERLIRDGISTRILEVKAEPSGVYFLVGPDGKAERFTAEPSRHCEVLATPEQLAQFALDAIEKAHRIDKPIILIGTDRIVFAYSAQERRDFAYCPLTLTKQYKLLEQWEKSPVLLTQREMIQALRVTFRGNVANGNLLPIVRQLKFESSSIGGNTVQHGSESMGRSLVAKVMGAEAIPEEFMLDIPVFEESRHLHRVECALDVDVQSARFTPLPFPQQLQMALEGRLEALVEYFTTTTKIPTFIGRPFSS